MEECFLSNLLEKDGTWKPQTKCCPNLTWLILVILVHGYDSFLKLWIAEEEGGKTDLNVKEERTKIYFSFLGKPEFQNMGYFFLMRDWMFQT